MRGRISLLLIGFMLLSSMVFSQEKREAKDSLIRLIEASSAQLQEVDGVSYRKIIGPAARFFHNNTYLIVECKYKCYKGVGQCTDNSGQYFSCERQD